MQKQLHVKIIKKNNTAYEHFHSFRPNCTSTWMNEIELQIIGQLGIEGPSKHQTYYYIICDLQHNRTTSLNRSFCIPVLEFKYTWSNRRN